MKKLLKEITITIILLITCISFSQEKEQENWTKNEKTQYNTFFNLARYIKGKQKSEISKDTLFKKYIYFDYVLNDTNTVRRENRLKVFDTIFYRFRKGIDSFGVENLDAKPIRFYKNHEIYNPFREDLAMKR